MWCAGDRMDCAINMIAVGLATLITVEERRHDLERQRRRHEERIAVERSQDQIAKAARNRMPDRDLAVVLDPRELVPRRFAAIDPLGAVERAPEFYQLRRVENRGMCTSVAIALVFVAERQQRSTPRTWYRRDGCNPS